MANKPNKTAEELAKEKAAKEAADKKAAEEAAAKKKKAEEESVEVLSGKLRKAHAQIEAFEKAEKERSEKELVEQNKFKELAEKKDEENKKLQAQLKTQAITTAVRLAATKAGVANADDFVRIVDTSGLTVSEDGTVDSKSVDELVTTAKSDKPYLFTGGQGGANIGTDNAGADGGDNQIPTFKRSQLKDSKFYAEHETEILAASKAGKIIDDISPNNQAGQPAKD